MVLAARGAVLTVDPEVTVQETNRRSLTGSNMALWYQPWELSDPDLHGYVRELAPAFVRIPGGSWANHYIWNGNGARLGEETFDLARLKDGVWDIDWSGYAPGFSIEGDERLPVSDHFHGSWHVKQLHDFVEQFGARAVVTVNLGSGTPEMAAEWVRWANIKNNYNVRYWELGNELEGAWELGHILPDGRRMTGGIYAERFAAFARAMKEVDPSIKTGGPASSNSRGAFIEELLRDHGDLVDFISFHTYPVENRVSTEAGFYDKINRLEADVARFRGWIEKHQPDRRDSIEIAITEWNSQVVENRVTADLMNALWSAAWVGEMFRAGIAFANQWDMITATAAGGHGLFYFDPFDFEQPGVPQEEMDRQFLAFDPPCIPKGQYWALYLWSRFMGDRLVESSLDDAAHLHAAVTRSDDALQVMLVNTSRTAAEEVVLRSKKPLASEGVAVRLSHHEYFWNPYTHAPRWSRRPEPVAVAIPDDGSISVPPFSVLVIQLPLGDAHDGAVAPVPARVPQDGIELLLPEKVPEDVPVEGWVLMPEPGSFVMGAEAVTARIHVQGPAELDVKEVRLNEGAGRFYLQPTGTGTIRVTARCGQSRAEAKLAAQPVQSRPEVLWRFDGNEGLEGVASDFKITLSDTARPNQQTAEIRLKNAMPREGGGGLLVFSPLPEALPKERVGGVVFDIRTSRGFAAANPGARLDVVLQSSADHWIPIGSLSLSGLKTGWQPVSIPIRDHTHFESMKWLYSIRFQLEAGRPVTGELFIDDAGVILR
jgi:hypothetical protein